MEFSAAQREKLLSRIVPVTDPGLKHKIVLYGMPGVGKTTLAAQLGNHNLMIMTETGDSVLTKPEIRHLAEIGMRVPFISLTGIRGYVEMMNDGTLLEEHLIVDNMSGIQDKKLSDNMEDPEIKGNAKIGRVHPDLSTQQDYQIIAHQMRPTIVDLMDCKKAVTLVCHMRPADPERKEYAIRPDLTRAIFNLANEKADVVAYMYKDRRGQRLIQTLGTDSVVAKSRITEERIDMTVPDFISAITNR